jgi:hypothetical protein
MYFSNVVWKLFSQLPFQVATAFRGGEMTPQVVAEGEMTENMRISLGEDMHVVGALGFAPFEKKRRPGIPFSSRGMYPSASRRGVSGSTWVICVTTGIMSITGLAQSPGAVVLS